MSVPLPPVMLARIAAEEAADEARRAQAAMDAADDRAMARRMAELADHRHQAATGHTVAEWEHARQVFAQARADAGRDPAAPLGSPANPELLLDGASLAPVARRHQVPDPEAVELARAEELAAWWAASEVARRMRAASDAACGDARRPVLSRSAGLPDPASMSSAARQAEIAELEAELAARPALSRAVMRGRAAPAVHPRAAWPSRVDPRVGALDRLPYGRVG